MVFQRGNSESLPETAIHLTFAEAGDGGKFSGIEVFKIQLVKKRFDPEHTRIGGRHGGFMKRGPREVHQHQFMKQRVRGKILVQRLNDFREQSPADIEIRGGKNDRQFPERIQRSIIFKPYFIMDIHHFKIGGDIHRKRSKRRYGNNIAGFDGIRMSVKMNYRLALDYMQDVRIVIDLEPVGIVFFGMAYADEGYELEFMSLQKFMIHSQQTASVFSENFCA